MKNTILFTAILLLDLTSLSKAQEPLSFRSNALGGVISDDLDLIYDPIELQFVGQMDKLSGNGVWDEGESFEDQNGNEVYDEGETFEDLPIIHNKRGVRLYTNLSNLTSTQEQLFDNVSDDEFLFGVSSQNPFMKFLWHSALVRFQNSETSHPVGIDSNLDGYTDIYGSGTLFDEYTAYLDTDYDGLYDLKKIHSQEKSDFTTDDSYSFILNNTLNMWGLTLGTKLSVDDATYTDNSASSNLGSGVDVLNTVGWESSTFHNSITIQHLIEDGNDNRTWSENGDFLTKNKVADKNLAVSVMFPVFWSFELRGDVNIHLKQRLSNVNDSYFGEYEYFDPEITSYTDTYSEIDSYISDTNEDGGEMAYGGSLRKTFNEQEERKNDGFWKLGFSMNSGSYDYTDSTSSQFSSIKIYYDGLDSLNIDFERTVSEQNSSSDIGEKKLNSYNFYGRFNIPLGEYVYFGIGGYYNQSTINRETDYIESQYDVTDYNYTDSGNFDNVLTETSQLKAERNYDISTTSFTFPVGLEYKIGKKRDWSLRFGSIFTNRSRTINDAKQITDSKPYVSEMEYGNGDVTIHIYDNVYESTSEHMRTISSSTVFTYGIGYNPFDNLQIDLLGIGSDDLDFDGVRLSFTMKF